jgi:hypothetical protein
MKTTNYLAVFFSAFLFAGCSDGNSDTGSSSYEEAPDPQASELPPPTLSVDSMTYGSPDSYYEENSASLNPTVLTYNDYLGRQPYQVSTIKIDTTLVKVQFSAINSQIDYLNEIAPANGRLEVENLNALKAIISQVVDTNDLLNLTSNCRQPIGINDLKDGISLESFDFLKGDEQKLGLMGFLNVNISNFYKVTIVEFSQIGSVVCNGKLLPYGVGARLMLQVTKRRKDAKLETPQQITASVVYNRAQVRYSIKTFGITGPKTAALIRSGTLSENTCSDFINAIADVIVDAYKKDSEYIIFPQYLPLRQQ